MYELLRISKNIHCCEDANVWTEIQVLRVVNALSTGNWLRMYVLLGRSKCSGDHNKCVLHVKAIEVTVFGTEFCYLNNINVVIRSTIYRCNLRYTMTVQNE
jgi:hypothetical protein